MRVFQIQKSPGKFRTIYAPSLEEKAVFRSALGDIARKARRMGPGTSHGFERGRSPVSNALQHVGHKYLLKIDLKSFFDTVTPDRTRGLLTKEQEALVFVDGAARQGLPTSPAVANLAAVAMDRAILKMIDKRKWQVVFTRYADDLGFSFDDPAIAEPLREAVYSVVRRCGFTPNLEKTKLMDANEGRQILTGIGIDHAGIHPTRKAKRKLRAAIHQGNEHSARGLSEWCKLKPPRERVYQAKEDELTSLSKAWNISLACLKNAPDKGPDEVVSCESGDVIITGDPIYMLGMSTWTTGWVSCMKQPSGSHRKGVLFWSLLRGTRLATLLSNSTMTVAGVTRRVMRARALVHTMRDGTIWGDRIYGNDGDKEILEKALAGRGIVHVSRAPRGLKVEGHVDARKKPYFDNLKSSVSTATNGQWKGRKVIVVHT